MFNKIKIKLLDELILGFAPFILKLLNIKLEIIFDKKKINNFVISNHVSEFDIFILYYILIKNNIKLRWVGDERLKNFPILGKWAQDKKGIFINRNKNGCSQLKKQIKKNDKIIIFPEGTLFYKHMIKKSNKICIENNIPKYKNVLCPKINGFNTISKIIEPKILTDITLIYHYKNKKFLSKSLKPLTIKNLLLNPPYKITVHIKNIKTKNKTRNFVNKIFYKKDKLIQKIL